jgi:hypothetical protein
MTYVSVRRSRSQHFRENPLDYAINPAPMSSRALNPISSTAFVRTSIPTTSTSTSLVPVRQTALVQATPARMVPNVVDPRLIAAPGYIATSKEAYGQRPKNQGLVIHIHGDAYIGSEQPVRAYSYLYLPNI